MKKLFAILFVPLLLLFSAVGVSAREQRTTKVITLPADEVITKDFYVTGGDVVEISGTVNGDVLVGGGQVSIDGIVNGDVLAAGGVIDISGSVSEDARIAGGQVNISGEIGRNLTVGAGDITLSETGSVAGGVVIGGGSVKLAGKVGGDVLIGAGSVILSNLIGGDVELYSGTLRLTSGSQIGGDLTYTSEDEALVDKRASISGKMLRKTPPAALVDVDKTAASKTLKGLSAFRLQAKIISFLSALIFGLLLIKLFPKYVELTSKMITKSPWKALLTGGLFLFVTPFAVIMLLITVLGIPFAIFGLMAFGTYIYLAKIFVGNWLGSKIPIGDKKNPYLSFGIGLAAYYLVTMIPLLGGFVSFFGLLFGIGMGLLACRDYYQEMHSSKTSA